MSEYAGFDDPFEEEDTGHVSIPYVILASILCGVGIFLTLAWVITFSWPLFLGVFVTTGGFLLLFDRRAGLDRAE
ncbi:MAG TPA: hypothetical protein VGV89_06825 [Thermoplasmata archaeon]|nr:hypothetical protein [Thermoplasmata archaeon]